MSIIYELKNVTQLLNKFDTSLNARRITTPDELENILEIMNSIEKNELIENLQNADCANLFRSYIIILIKLVDVFKPMKQNHSDFPQDLELPDDLIRSFLYTLHDSDFHSEIVKELDKYNIKNEILHPVADSNKVHRRCKNNLY